MCYSQNQYDAPEPGEPIKTQVNLNPERMTRGMTREDY